MQAGVSNHYIQPFIHRKDPWDPMPCAPRADQRVLLKELDQGKEYDNLPGGDDPKTTAKTTLVLMHNKWKCCPCRVDHGYAIYQIIALAVADSVR